MASATELTCSGAGYAWDKSSTSIIAYWLISSQQNSIATPRRPHSVSASAEMVLGSKVWFFFPKSVLKSLYFPDEQHELLEQLYSFLSFFLLAASSRNVIIQDSIYGFKIRNLLVLINVINIANIPGSRNGKKEHFKNTSDFIGGRKHTDVDLVTC